MLYVLVDVDFNVVFSSNRLAYVYDFWLCHKNLDYNAIYCINFQFEECHLVELLDYDKNKD